MCFHYGTFAFIMGHLGFTYYYLPCELTTLIIRLLKKVNKVMLSMIDNDRTSESNL